MLVLSRKRDEEIIIRPHGPGPIAIKVLGIRGDKVRIGITADCPVNRREVDEELYGSLRAEAEVAT